MSGRTRTLTGWLGLLTILLSAGCDNYSTVSPVAYQYSKALYSICNRQDTPSLANVAALVESAHAEAQLNDQELRWLREIIETAETGDWQEAATSARQLMEAQVVR